MNVFKNIEKFSSNIAVITEESKKITYKELLIYSKKISNKISNNTLVLIICINTLEDYDCVAENAYLEQAGSILSWGLNNYNELEFHYFKLKLTEFLLLILLNS